MRLYNFVLDTTINRATGSLLRGDGTNPSSREIIDSVYPFSGDVKIDHMHIFQGATLLQTASIGSGESFMNLMVSGSVNDSVNYNDTLKMTGSLSAHIDSEDAALTDTEYKWSILMVADSIFGG